MRSILALAIIVLTFNSCKTSVTTPEEIICTPFAERTSVKTDTGNDSAWLQLPCDYNANSAKHKAYPLLIFFNGTGEAVDDGGLDAALRLGPPKLMADSFRFTFNVQEKQYDFIVICPQSYDGYRSVSSVNPIIDDVIARYRVDVSRIYLTGLSAGAQTLYNYLTDKPANATRIAAAVPMSVIPISNMHKSNLKYITDAGAHIEEFCGDQDDILNANKEYVKILNGFKADIANLITYKGKHCCWNKVYDTAKNNFRPNIYEWMLQYHR